MCNPFIDILIQVFFSQLYSHRLPKHYMVNNLEIQQAVWPDKEKAREDFVVHFEYI